MYQLDFLRLGVRRMHEAPALIERHAVIQAADRGLAISGATFADFADLLADVDVNGRARPEHFIGKRDKLG